MKIHRSAGSLVVIAALGASALGVGAAQAREVFWSVGIASPGVQLGVSNTPQMLYQRPVVVVPQPVYYGQPQPVYYGQPQLVYAQPRVVYAPRPNYVGSGWAQPDRSWRPRHYWQNDRWDNDRWDRGNDRREFHGGRGNSQR